ncbi:MAG: tetratricopeptide repeat protein [Pirellulaceae bacterium]
MPASSDRNLLFGILALQMDFITREQLVAGMQAWVLAKDIALAEHLVQAGAMKPANRQLLEPLVEAHIRQHGDDPQQSLASISSFEHLRNELARLKDQEIDVSIANIPAKSAKDADPFATISVGAASSQGMRFRILRPHAEGGLGRVSVALDSELGREVALKEIKPERADDPDSRGRFTREAEITGGLEHPGIVPVYGLGAYPDGRPFYAMRFIRGKSLKEAIEKFHEGAGGSGLGAGEKASGGRKPPGNSASSKYSPTEENLELRKLLQRLIDVCEAMDYAHSRGVLHRDLKPGNIMLGKFGETLVVDWGLAKPLGKSPTPVLEQQPTDTTLGLSSLPEAALHPSTSGSEPTLLGSALGTPAFMSPEQAQGRLDLLGPASDVFSLGAILYQILTGQPPYTAATKDDVLHKAQIGDYPAPRTLRRGIPPSLEAICLKALAPLSPNRYPTCRALAQDLERFLADEPVTARRDSIAERLSRLSRRHRTAFMAAAAALVLLAAGSLLALGVVNHFRNVAVKETGEREKARQAEAQRAAGERLAKLDAETQKVKALSAVTRERRTIEILGSVSKYLNPRQAEKDGMPLTGMLSAWLDRAFKELEAEADGDPTAVARLQVILAKSQNELGYPNKGITLCLKARETLTAHLGPDHPDTITSMNNLADTYARLKQFDTALSLYTESMELCEASLEGNHPQTLSTKEGLAGVYQAINQLDKAIPLYEQTLEVRRAVLRLNHPDTLANRHNLALCYKRAGQLDKAIPLYEESLNATKAELSIDHPSTLQAMHNLAAAYDAAHELEKALLLFEETLERRMAKLGPEDSETLNTMGNLAGVYVDQGRVADALPLFDEFVKGRRKLHSDEPLRFANYLAIVSLSLLKAGEYARAQDHLSECLAIREKVEPDIWTTFSTQSMLGAALLGQEKYTDAEPLLLKGYDGMKQREGTIPPPARVRLAESLDRLIELYTATKKPDEVAKWQAERAKYSEEKAK